MVLTELYEPKESSSKFEIFTYKVSLGRQEKRSCFGIHRGEKIREKKLLVGQLWNCAVQEKKFSYFFTSLSSPNLQIQQFCSQVRVLLLVRQEWVMFVCLVLLLLLFAEGAGSTIFMPSLLLLCRKQSVDRRGFGACTDDHVIS